MTSTRGPRTRQAQRPYPDPARVCANAVAAALAVDSRSRRRRLPPPASTAGRGGLGQGGTAKPGGSAGPGGTARSGSAPGRHSALRPATGLALVATGAILLIAVHIRAGFLNPAPAGLILLAVGLAWLWLPVRDKHGLLRGHADRLRHLLAQDTGLVSGARVPLTELLSESEQVAAGPTGEADSAGHVG